MGCLPSYKRPPSLSYTIGRSNFQAKDLKREQLLIEEYNTHVTAADRNSITIFCINAVKVEEAIVSTFRIKSTDVTMGFCHYGMLF